MTFATRRSLRRSQIIDHDELADTKIGLISMLPSTQPKRREDRQSRQHPYCAGSFLAPSLVGGLAVLLLT